MSLNLWLFSKLIVPGVEIPTSEMTNATTNSGLDLINDCVREYLCAQRSDCAGDGWTIGCSGGDSDNGDEGSSSVVAGRGIVATRNHSVGEVIFVDTPLIVSPRAVQRRHPQLGLTAVCPVCYGPPAAATANGCPAGCQLPVCGQRCADQPDHSGECRYLQRLGPVTDNDGRWLTGVYNAIAPVRGLLALKDGPYRCFLDILQKKYTEKPVFEARTRWCD